MDVDGLIRLTVYMDLDLKIDQHLSWPERNFSPNEPIWITVVQSHSFVRIWTCSYFIPIICVNVNMATVTLIMNCFKNLLDSKLRKNNLKNQCTKAAGSLVLLQDYVSKCRYCPCLFLVWLLSVHPSWSVAVSPLWRSWYNLLIFNEADYICSSLDLFTINCF